jgi:hypothetical protein
VGFVKGAANELKMEWVKKERRGERTEGGKR